MDCLRYAMLVMGLSALFGSCLAGAQVNASEHWITGWATAVPGPGDRWSIGGDIRKPDDSHGCPHHACRIQRARPFFE